MLSEIEKIVLKSIGDAIVKDKDAAIEIMLNVVNSSTDESTSLEFVGILSFAEGIFNTLIWKICPTVEFYCDLVRSRNHYQYQSEFLAVFGWSK